MIIDGYNFNARLKAPFRPTVSSRQTALQVTVGTGYTTSFNFDPTKVRFTSEWGNVIPHYYEGEGTLCYKFWFRTILTANSDGYVYIYFDPSIPEDVTDTSNGANVFHFFDAFSASTLYGYPGGNWTTYGTGTTFSATGMSITSGGVMLSSSIGNQLSLKDLGRMRRTPQSWPEVFETINFNDGSFTIEAAILSQESSLEAFGGGMLLATNGGINKAWSITADADDMSSPPHYNSYMLMAVREAASSKEIGGWAELDAAATAPVIAVTSNAPLSITNIWGMRQWDTGESVSSINSGVLNYSTKHACVFSISEAVSARTVGATTLFCPGQWYTNMVATSAVKDSYHNSGMTFLALGAHWARYINTASIKPTIYKWIRIRKNVSGVTTALWDNTTNPALPLPQPLSPANGSILSPGPVTFRVSVPTMWASYEAEGYTCSIALSKDGFGLPSIPMATERLGVLAATALGVAPAATYSWYVVIKKGGEIVTSSTEQVFTTVAENVYPDVMIDNPLDTLSPISINTASDIYTQTLPSSRLNTITAQVFNRGMQPLTDNTIRIWLQNPVAEQLPMTPAGIAAFPTNVAITVSTLTTSTPDLEAGRPLESYEYAIKESNNIIWWPVLSSIAPTLAGIDETNLSTTRYQKWNNCYYSLFSVKLTPNAINRIDIVYYTLQPGDYAYTTTETSGLINFNRRTLYVPYYPNLATDSSGIGYWLSDSAPSIIPSEGVNSADIAQLTAASPVVAESIVAGPGALSQYRLSTAPLTRPTDYSYIGGGSWTDISRIAQPNILPNVRPNNYLYIEARMCYMDIVEDKAILNVAINSQTVSYMYAVPPKDATVYNYASVCRIVDDASEATMTVYKTDDMEKVRYYIWDLSGQTLHPEMYLNMPHTGPFSSCQLAATGFLPEIPVAVYDVSKEMDTVTFVNDTIAANTLTGWAAKPINGANSAAPDTDGPWAVNGWRTATNMLYYDTESVSQPTLIGPSGTIVNLVPGIEFVSTAGSVYNYWLLKKVGELWEQVPGVQGTIATASASLVKQEFLPAGFVLNNLTTYLLVLHDVGTPDRLAGCPAFSSFTTALPPLAEITKIADAAPVIIDRNESNIRRFAISINHLELSAATIASGSVAVTKAVGLPAATTAISIEAGAYFPPDTTNSITCELQFNGDGAWHSIAPTSWPTTEAPSVLFINQRFDQTTISNIEAEYGCGSVVILTDVAFSVRLRFTMLHPDAKLQRFITIKGIS